MTINFQSLHAPRGAHAHFAHESDRATSNDVFIDWKRGNQIACFPFFRNAQSAELATFVHLSDYQSTFLRIRQIS